MGADRITSGKLLYWIVFLIFSHVFAIILVVVTILCIPSLLIHDIIIVETSDSKALYSIGVSKLAANNNCFLFKLNLWLTGILFKVRLSKIKKCQRF